MVKGLEAITLCSRAAHVVVNYPFPGLKEQGDAVASRHKQRSIAIEADRSTVEGPQRLVEANVKEYGKVDIPVNNAALAINKPFEEQNLDDWDNLVPLNGRGTFLLTQAVLNIYHQTVEAGSSTLRPSPRVRVFLCRPSTQARRVWSTVSRRLKAKELSPKYGCTVNAVSTGPTMTEGFADAGEEFMKKMQPVIDKIPVGNRLGTPEEIAFAVAFLCEPRASWVNGEHLIVDGGLFID